MLFSSASTVLRVRLFLLALLVVRGLPAVLYRPALSSIRDVAAAGLLQTTSLTFIVAATTIGLQLHAIRPANAAALVAAGLSASSFFPSSRCSCSRSEHGPGAAAPSLANASLTGPFLVSCRVCTSGRPLRFPGPAQKGASLFWGCSTPHAVVLAEAQGLVEAVGGDLAPRAYCLGF